MKNSKVIYSILVIFLLLSSCFKEEDELTQPYKAGAVIPEITNITSSFFDSFNFDGAYIEFTVTAENPSDLTSITIEETFGDQTKDVGTYTSFPAVVKVTATDAVSGLTGVTLNSLEVGDEFVFQIIATSKSGVTSRSNALLRASVACKSSLAGTYTSVANGTSTDPGPDASVNPAVDYEYEVTLTETGVNGVYTISEFSGGLWSLWYSIYGIDFDVEGTIQDVCNDISYINTTEPFGSPISGTGSVDPATGVITLEGTADLWGDTWTLVLTPK